MKKYRKRFTKEEFKKELVDHIKSKPAKYDDKQFEKYADKKAGHYLEALESLDQATKKIRQIAANHPDPQAKKEADFAIRQIEDSIAAYGDAVFDYNSSWVGVAE